MRKLKNALPPVLLVLSLLAIIQILVDTGAVKRYVLPSPTDVASAFVLNFNQLISHSASTLSIAMLGFIMSIILAFILAILIDTFEPLRRAVYPLVIVSQTIPIMAVTPVIVLLLGFGVLPKIAVIVLVCFFPVCISLIEGFEVVDRDVIRLMQTMGAGKMQIMRHVKLPSSVSGIFSGLKITATYSIMAAVIAEWLGAETGIGVYMMRVKRGYSYDRMFAAIIMIIILSVLVFKLVQVIQYAVLVKTGAKERISNQNE